MRFSNRTIAIVSVAFFILSILDGVCTLWGLSLGAIFEANPIARMLINYSPIFFMLIKVWTPVALGIFCWNYREEHRKLVTYSLTCATGVYMWLSALHFYWIYMLVRA